MSVPLAYDQMYRNFQKKYSPESYGSFGLYQAFFLRNMSAIGFFSFVLCLCLLFKHLFIAFAAFSKSSSTLQNILADLFSKE